MLWDDWNPFKILATYLPFYLTGCMLVYHGVAKPKTTMGSITFFMAAFLMAPLIYVLGAAIIGGVLR